MITNMLDELKAFRVNRSLWNDQIQQLLADIVPNTTSTILVPRNHQRTLNIRVFDTLGDTVAKFSLSFLPGCKGVFVMHRMEVTASYRRRGIARQLLIIKERIARDLGVSLLMCTTSQMNIEQNMLLKTSNGWHYTRGFTNARTNNRVYMWTKRLNVEQL